MIGYMKPVKNMFSREDRDIYQSLYCGLCRCLKLEYGFTGIAALNYAAVNALVLTGALAPEPYPLITRSCTITPLIWRKMAGQDDDSFRAAAAVTIAAAALEIQDNLHDGDRWFDRLLNAMVDPKARRMMAMFGREFQELKEAYDDFMALEERAAAGDPDVTFRMLMEASGTIIARGACIIGIYGNCPQLKELYQIMDLWGRWIYLLDAADDYAGDHSRGRFNPLDLPDRPRDVRATLEDIENSANQILGDLMLRNYDTLARSLLCDQLPRRRELVLGKINMQQIEGA